MCPDHFLTVWSDEHTMPALARATWTVYLTQVGEDAEASLTLRELSTLTGLSRSGAAKHRGALVSAGVLTEVRRDEQGVPVYRVSNTLPD